MPTIQSIGHTALRRAAVFCYMAIAAGQAAFILFILLYYYSATLTGNWVEWNEKPIITGYVPGDYVGNIFFAAHVLMAAIITFSGLLQLVPLLRMRWPAFHRWNGRLYLLVALTLSLGGLWMVWVRGTWLTIGGAFGISLNAALIIIAAAMAWRHARARNFVAHRCWAIRLFVLASAVWFMRVGYMAWGLATGGAGIGKALDGPFDLFIAFANSLLPLAVAEMYLRVDLRGTPMAKSLVASLLILCAITILGGSIGAWLVMWGPYV